MENLFFKEGWDCGLIYIENPTGNELHTVLAAKFKKENIVKGQSQYDSFMQFCDGFYACLMNGIVSQQAITHIRYYVSNEIELWEKSN